MTDPLTRNHRRRRFGEWLALCAALLAVGGYLGYSQRQDYIQIEAEQRERLTSQVTLIEKNLIGQLQAVRRALDGIVDDLPVLAASPDARRQAIQRLNTVSSTLTGVAALLVTDAQGVVIASNLPRLLGTDVSNRPYFQAARLQQDAKIMHVAAPFSNDTGSTTIALARQIVAPNGSFGGVVTAWLDPDFFWVLLNSVLYTPDAWTYLAHGDGRLFMMSPERGELVGKDLAVANSLFSRHRHSGDKVSVFSGSVYATGEDRMIALQTIYPRELLMDKPLVVAISRDLETIVAQSRRAAIGRLMLFTAAVLISVFSLAVLQRRTRELRHQRALMDREARQLAAFDASPDTQLISDEQGIIIRANPPSADLLGYAVEELVGQPMDRLIPQRFRGVHAGRQMDFVDLPASRWMCNGAAIKVLRRDGTECDVAIKLSRIETVHGLMFVSVLRDVTARRHAEEQLRIAAAAFELQEGMMITDANRMVLRVNLAFTAITGYSGEDVIGKRMNFLKSDHHDGRFYAAIWAAVRRQGSWQGEVWNRIKNGEVHPHWVIISAVKDSDDIVTHYVGALTDITERKKADARIAELAFFDQLTGLPNRALLLDRLKQAMATSARSGDFAALLFIDLDNFKSLNDSLGHGKGDLLLAQVAQRLLLCVREGDTVARLGGDEFVVVLNELSTSEVEAGANTRTVAKKILDALNQSYQLGDVWHHSSASMGATLVQGQVATADDLMKQADLAMYRTKESGRNALCFFDPEMETAVLERVAMEKDLFLAIQANQFLLYYQAQVVDNGRLTGAEVLIRWQHPQRGLVSPAEFIPLAEQTGLILPLGQWVLETACAQLAHWSSQIEMSHLMVAVNVSARQFRQVDFVDRVLAVLERTGANPSRLKLELTESLLVDNVKEVIQKMTALRARGVSFSLDDFGTGYSSLSYLKRLPLNQLKIDQSFVRDVLVDPNDAAIAGTIVALANSLGLAVIAEGVETESQRDFLAMQGCHAYQGYLFGRPVPLQEFEHFAMHRADDSPRKHTPCDVRERDAMP